jgi:chorismate mutase/prephenate dehydrogenase
MTQSALDRLRRALADIDREILSHVARRQALASEIGRAKRGLGRPTRDFAQEKEVLERAAEQARTLGVSPELAERIFAALIRSSLTVQEQDGVAAGGRGDGRRVLVIGGAGRMGRWFVRFLGSQGFVIEIADPAGPVEGCRSIPDWRTSPLDHDVVIVAAQLRPTREILLELAQRPPRGLVFDIGSLKSPLRDALRGLAAAGARVTSIHPMFGPGAELLTGRHVIFVDVGVPEAVREARALFDATMAIQVEMDLESHDRLIAHVLGLSHALSIAFVAALSESGEAAAELAQISSTTFDAQLAVASQVVHENPRLYWEIQALNDYRDLALGTLAAVLERLRRAIDAGDEQAFVALMEQGRSYLDGRQAPPPHRPD